MSQQQLSRRILSAIAVRGNPLNQHTYQVVHQTTVPENDKLACQYFLLQKEINFIQGLQGQIDTELSKVYPAKIDRMDFIQRVCNSYAA